MPEKNEKKIDEKKGTNKFDNLLQNLSQNETEKLAIILAAMQKISETEQEKVLPKNEVLQKADVIKTQLPEKPTDILLQFVRNNQEKKIEKSKENIKVLDEKIGKRQRQSKKFRRKIIRLTTEITKFKTANNFLENIGSDSTIKDFLMNKNDNSIAKIEEKIRKLEVKVSVNDTKIENFGKSIIDQNNEIIKAVEKINRVDEIKDFPNAAVMFFLAEKFGLGEKALENPTQISDQIINLADELSEQLSLQNEFDDGEDLVNKQLNGAEYQAEVVKLADKLGANFDAVNNALAREFQSRDSFPIESKFGEIKFHLYNSNAGVMLEIKAAKDTFFNGKDETLAGTYLYGSQELPEFFELLEGLNYSVKVEIKDGEMKTDAFSSGSLTTELKLHNEVLRAETDEEVNNYTDETAKFYAQHPKIGKLYLQKDDSETGEFLDGHMTYLRQNNAEGNFRAVVKTLEKLGFDEDIADFTAMKMANMSEFSQFLEIPSDYKGAEFAKPISENAQYVPPPNFEFEQQPVSAVPYTSKFEKSQNSAISTPPKKETDELPTSDPNTKDEGNPLNPENANSQEKKSPPEKLGKIEISKSEFDEVKPKLQNLKENGVFMRVCNDKNNSDNVKIFFNKADKEQFENILNAKNSAKQEM